MHKKIGFFIFLLVLAVSFRLAAQNCEQGNCVNGKGKMTWPEGTYVGQFKNGVMQGIGVMQYKDGKKYTGAFKAGKFNGRGKLQWATGDEYEGQFVDGQMHGKGVMKWKKGDRYEGEWKNGTMEGKGTMRFSNGTVMQGIWKDGKIAEGGAKGADVSVIGTWKEYPVDPLSGTYDAERGIYVFSKGGTGTLTRESEAGERKYNFTWSLKGSTLTITYEFEAGVGRGENKMVTEYTYDAAKKWYASKPEPYGPEGKIMSKSVLKK